MKSLTSIFLTIFIFLIACQQKRDYVVDDDKIRDIINQRNFKRTREFPKYVLNKREYGRILISRKLLTEDWESNINVFEFDPEESYYKIYSIPDKSKYPGIIEFIPYIESDYLVYEIDKLPSQKLFFWLVAHSGTDPEVSFICGFGIEIYKSKVLYKKKELTFINYFRL